MTILCTYTRTFPDRKRNDSLSLSLSLSLFLSMLQSSGKRQRVLLTSLLYDPWHENIRIRPANRRSTRSNERKNERRGTRMLLESHAARNETFVWFLACIHDNFDNFVSYRSSVRLTRDYSTVDLPSDFKLEIETRFDLAENRRANDSRWIYFTLGSEVYIYIYTYESVVALWHPKWHVPEEIRVNAEIGRR